MLNSFIRLKSKLFIMRKTYLQLNHYYPKNTYDRMARKEMKIILLKFNETFFSTFPHLLTTNQHPLLDYFPKHHSKQYEVDRVMALCKLQKIRRKDMVKIEELLNLKYIIEEQIDFYEMNIEKVQDIRKAISDELFEPFYPTLFKERIFLLNDMENHYNERIEKYTDENLQCEQRIEELVRKGQGFFGEASDFIGEIFTESMRKINHSLKWK